MINSYQVPTSIPCWLMLYLSSGHIRSPYVGISQRNCSHGIRQGHPQIPDTGKFIEMRMTCLTFGVISSPFIATQVLRRLAMTHKQEFPRAAEVILTQLYVDDCLAGAKTIEDAIHLRTELNTLLTKTKITLRKWRPNSTQLLETIPVNLQETADEKVDQWPRTMAKNSRHTLGHFQ